MLELILRPPPFALAWFSTMVDWKIVAAAELSRAMAPPPAAELSARVTWRRKAVAPSSRSAPPSVAELPARVDSSRLSRPVALCPTPATQIHPAMSRPNAVPRCEIPDTGVSNGCREATSADSHLVGEESEACPIPA
ncbi:MAG: hypothetical protein GXX96_14780 [Planctomycetaceae bacterium]|nr:hypothetical protein [Planctomycetaceae bacterium]